MLLRDGVVWCGVGQGRTGRVRQVRQRTRPLNHGVSVVIGTSSL